MQAFKPTFNKLWAEIRQGPLPPRRTHELLDALMSLAIGINRRYAEAASPAATHPEHHLYLRSVSMVEDLTDMCFSAMAYTDAISLREFMEKHLSDVIDH